MINKKEFTGIDILKFIMAIIVVSAHTHPFEGIDNYRLIKIWNMIVNFAIPYFFMASGFFLFLKINKIADKLSQLEQIKSYSKRIVELYIYWTIIYLPITIWGFANNDMIYYKDILMFLRGFFIVGENFYSWPLWYLLSMIYSLIVIYILISKDKKYNFIFVASIFIFIISILISFIIDNNSNTKILSNIHNVIKLVFHNGRIFSGMLYIMIGALFATSKMKMSKSILFSFVLIGVIFQIFQYPFISSLAFVLLPTVIFYFSINWSVTKFKSGYFFRKCSTVMYFMHMIVLFLYTLLFKGMYYFGFDAFLISVLIPILLTPIILKYEKIIVPLKKIF